MSFAWTAIGVAVVGAATSITLGSISAHQQKAAAKQQLVAQSQQAKVQADQRMKQTRLQAAQNKSSFLSSGISLTGDGTPDSVISDTYDTGMQDVENIKQYGAQAGANITANARAKMMATYGAEASSVASYASGALKGAGTISAAGSTSGNFGGDLNGMGDTYGMGGLGSGSALQFDNYQAPASFGGGV